MTATLQAAGVPAGFMQRAADYEDDPQLQARDFLRTFEQPGLEPMAIENAPFRSERIPRRPTARARAGGAHAQRSARGCSAWIADDVDRLVADGVLEEPMQSPDAGQPALPG